MCASQAYAQLSPKDSIAATTGMLIECKLGKNCAQLIMDLIEQLEVVSLVWWPDIIIYSEKKSLSI